MRIKGDRPGSLGLNEYGAGISWRRILLASVGAGALLGALLLGANTILLERERVREQIGLVARQQHAILATDPERLVFDIGHKETRRLRFDRELAMAQRINLPGPEDYVKAEVRHDGKTARAKVRLKGVYSPNWDDEKKWSLLIKLKGGETIMGLRRFAIQHPKEDSFIYESLFLAGLRDEGLIAQRYRFVDVVINGEDYGIYAMVEHYGKILVEGNRRREGPIVGFNKDVLLEEFRRTRLEKIPTYNVDGAFWSAFVDGIQQKAIQPASEREALMLKAMALLESFRIGRLDASEVFDVDQMAMGLALKVLFGAYEYDWKDLKFYYNPITGKLEPILAEVHYDGKLVIPGWWLNDGPHPYMEAFTGRLFEDERFFASYVRALERVSRPEYLTAFLDRHHVAIQKNLLILHREFPSFEFTDRSLSQIQAQIRAILTPLHAARAYFLEEGDDAISLQVGSLQHLPLEILYATDASGVRFEPVRAEVVPGKKAAELVRYQTVELRASQGATSAAALSPGSTRSDLKLHYRLLGLAELREIAVSPWNHIRPDLALDDPIRRVSDFRGRPFLLVDDESNEIHFLPGRWTLTENLVIPVGYRVSAGPGVHLDLRNDAFILSHSPVHFTGSEDSPIVVESSDHAGQGFAVIGADGTSVLDAVVFRGLSAPSQGGWSLSGAITFYESDVDFRGCILLENVGGDDLLNIVRSRFSIVDSRLAKSHADALDADFSEGLVQRTLFESIGNDAIDLSGSRVRLSEIEIDRAGDKGLSFGEASTVEGERVRIGDTRIGIASKDHSQAMISHVVVDGAETGLAIYQKKPEFGPASLSLGGFEGRRIRVSHLVERSSFLTVNGEKIAGDREQVAALLYAEESRGVR